MNREERRRQEKLGYSKQSIMEKYRYDAYSQGHTDGMKSVIEITFYMTAYTLQYKLDMSPEQLQEIMKAVYNNIDAYRTGHLSPEDYDTIVNEIRDTYGVNLNVS